MLTKIHLVKAMVFPVVMYRCESWTIKKAEHRRIDAFEVWCWRRLLRVPWLQGNPTSPSYSKSIFNIHWKDWCWSWNSSTLASWYKELTHLKTPWCWERLKVGGEGDYRGWDVWMASPTLGVGDGKRGLHATVHGVAKSRTQQNNWTEMTDYWFVLSIWWPVAIIFKMAFLCIINYLFI